MTHYEVQVLTLPVADVDRALEFYSRRLGFPIDVDYHPSSDYRVVQLTPPRSACSIQFGIGLTDAPPGSARSNYLVVADLEAAHLELLDRGLQIGPIQHKTPVGDWQGELEAGLDPQRRDYASLATFTDPDGNTWILQEVSRRAPEPAAAGTHDPAMNETR